MMKAKSDKHYALYVRVSTEEQARAKEGSLRSQETAVARFSEYQGDRFEDCRLSRGRGSRPRDTNRAEYQKLLGHIKQGKIGAVVFTEISRISRSTIDFLNFADICHKYQVDLLCLKTAD